MTLNQVEDALLAAVRAVVTNRVRVVASLPGDWDDDMLRKFAAQLPAVYVAFLGGPRKEAAGGNQARIDARFAVYVCTGHPTEEARRRGNAQAAGAYELMGALVPALHGRVITGVGSLDLADVQNLYTGSVERQALTVYALTFGLPMSFEPDVDDALAPFETFDVQYDIPAFNTADHAKWLAGDYSTSRPDAQDTVDLPQP